MDAITRELAFDLIEANGTLDQVRSFLRDRRLTHSASSWEQIRTERLAAHLASGNLTSADIAELLREAEEYGGQHVFLYATSKAQAKKLLSVEAVEIVIDQEGLSRAYQGSLIVDRPDDPEIVDIRFERGARGRRLVIKIVESRERFVRVSESRETGDDYALVMTRYEREVERGVNLFVLHESGLLELRLDSYKQRSKTLYEDAVYQAWELVAPFLPRKVFDEHPVAAAKDQLWRRRDELSEMVEFRSSSIRNNQGTQLIAYAKPDGSLYKDSRASESIDGFFQSDAHCEEQLVAWVPGDNGVPSRKVVVALRGAINELVIAARCSQADYEYVLEKLDELNN